MSFEENGSLMVNCDPYDFGQVVLGWEKYEYFLQNVIKLSVTNAYAKTAPNSELRAGFYARKRVSVFCCLMQNARSGKGGAWSSVFSPGPCILKSTAVRFCLSELRFLCSCAFFTHFYFELAFGVKMKVLYKFVGFPMNLVWLENYI